MADRPGARSGPAPARAQGAGRTGGGILALESGLTPARKIAAALAAGTACIPKPRRGGLEPPSPSPAPMTKAGLLPRVVSLGVPSEISTHLIASPVIREISFTGSTVVRQGARPPRRRPGVKRATMGLGGHAPVVIFEDADDAAPQHRRGCEATRAGQVCLSLAPSYVQEKVHDDFAMPSRRNCRKLPQGPGLEPGNRVGPMANPDGSTRWSASLPMRGRRCEDCDGRQRGRAMTAGSTRRRF